MANPLTSREGTLGSMMTELKARLGFVTQGASSKLIDPLLKSFLQEGHEYVYEQLGAPLLKKRTTIMLQKGSKLYDCHNDIEDENFEPAMIESICVYDTETSFNELRQGITELMRCGDITPTVPERYDILDGQIELWPTPDDAYRMVVIYRPGLTRFTQPADHACVPSRLVFLYALASAKAHYQHPDAQTAGNIFQQALRIERQKQHENKRYSTLANRPRARTQVRRTSDGRYFF